MARTENRPGQSKQPLSKSGDLLVLLFVDQGVRLDPRHHAAQRFADFLDRVGVTRATHLDTGHQRISCFLIVSRQHYHDLHRLRPTCDFQSMIYLYLLSLFVTFLLFPSPLLVMLGFVTIVAIPFMIILPNIALYGTFYFIGRVAGGNGRASWGIAAAFALGIGVTIGLPLWSVNSEKTWRNLLTAQDVDKLPAGNQSTPSVVELRKVNPFRRYRHAKPRYEPACRKTCQRILVDGLAEQVVMTHEDDGKITEMAVYALRPQTRCEDFRVEPISDLAPHIAAGNCLAHAHKTTLQPDLVAVDERIVAPQLSVMLGDYRARRTTIRTASEPQPVFQITRTRSAPLRLPLMIRPVPQLPSGAGGGRMRPGLAFARTYNTSNEHEFGEAVIEWLRKHRNGPDQRRVPSPAKPRKKFSELTADDLRDAPAETIEKLLARPGATQFDKPTRDALRKQASLWLLKLRQQPALSRRDRDLFTAVLKDRRFEPLDWPLVDLSRHGRQFQDALPALVDRLARPVIGDLGHAHAVIGRTIAQMERQALAPHADRILAFLDGEPRWYKDALMRISGRLGRPTAPLLKRWITFDDERRLRPGLIAVCAADPEIAHELLDEVREIFVRAVNGQRARRTVPLYAALALIRHGRPVPPVPANFNAFERAKLMRLLAENRPFGFPVAKCSKG
jgi:hypothetical protein